jgi:signal transduction histidine kinase
MNDELSVILDRYEELVGRLRETDAVASEQVDDSRKTVERLKKFNGRLLEFQKALSTKMRTQQQVKSRTRSRTTTSKGK